MIDKKKRYIIVDALTQYGETNPSAAHRIGRKGLFMRLIKGMRFEFAGEDNRYLKSSSVLDISQEDDLVKVLTFNTLYVFKELSEDE